jgi:pimeloyl-ACP methyl ester carboxylesterase
MQSIDSTVLEIFYEELGPESGPPVLLLHGWPDAPRGWASVANLLQANGWRTIVPYLRGSRPTRFLSQDTPRFAAGVALAQDAIDLADALHLDRFAVIGHDWGARAAYTMAALFPERLTAIAALHTNPAACSSFPILSSPEDFGISGFSVQNVVLRPCERTRLGLPVFNGIRGARQDGSTRQSLLPSRDFLRSRLARHHAERLSSPLDARRGHRCAL